MNQRLQAIIETYFRTIMARHYVLISACSIMLTALAIWTIASRWNINSDFKELLPQSSAAAQAMQEVGDRVGSGSSLFVVIDSPDSEQNLAFATKYAEKLRDNPQVALAHFHNDKTFFEENQLLYLEREDITTIYDRIRRRIREEKQRANPLFVPLTEPTRADSGPIDVSDIEAKYDDLAHDGYKEYLVSDDGYSLTIVVRFVETSTDLTATNRLLDEVRATGEALNPRSFHPDMTIEFGGGLVHRQAEYSSIVDDIQTSALFTVIGLLLVISLYFRRLRAVVLVVGPLVMGIVWTLALAFLIFGELTTITVFIFVILLGLGIDFSIHLLNGYDFERLNGHEPVEALLRCYNSVGKATVIGATTTFVTFVVLSFAQFRGLSQFGQVASLGVLCTIGAMIVVLPALILTFQKILPHNPGKRTRVANIIQSDRWLTAKNLARTAPILLIISMIFTILAGLYIPSLTFEENFRKIGDINTPWSRGDQTTRSEASLNAERSGRNLARDVHQTAITIRENIEPETFVADREQLTTGAKYTSALRGQQSSTPTLLLLDDADQATEVYRVMSEMLANGQLPSVRSIGSIHAFIPGSLDEQYDRIEEIERIQNLLDREDLSILSAKDREQLQEFEELLDVDVITVYDLPDWTKRLFREAGPKAKAASPGQDYAFEYLIYVNESIDHMIGSQARRFLSEVQSVADKTGLDIRIGSQSYIYTAMLDEIKEDGALMLSIALVIVYLLMSFFFHGPLRAYVTLIPLIVGAAWMFGFAAWFGIKLDFFNVIILPVVIGLGVDDGVHFYHRYLELGQGSILDVIHQVGSAISMTTLTSIIGFGGLAVTHYAGLQSIGYFAIVGIASAYLATILVLPAFLWLVEKYQWRRFLPAPQHQNTNSQ